LKLSNTKEIQGCHTLNKNDKIGIIEEGLKALEINVPPLNFAKATLN